MEQFQNVPILLVDDEEGIRKVLSISLKEMGFEILQAENGDEAFEIFKKNRPPIILADIKMPGMDGIELLRQVKKISPDSEVIMITGHGELDLAIESLKYEAIDFVTKPIHEDVLKIALKRALEKIAMRNALKEYTENLEQLVKEKSDKLIKSERLSAIGDTIEGLSHAIKNIVGGLNGGTFILERGIESDDQKYILQGWELLKGNVDKIKNLSMDLLNYAKPPEIKYILSHPNTPVKEVINLMGSKAEARGVKLKPQLDSNLRSFYFDPDGIHRCLLNLVANAIDACHDDECDNKEKIVKIRTEKTSGWGVEYLVMDNCGGMDTEIQKKIFNSFFTSKGSQGTGIGLMITKKIIDEHKGTINFITEKNKGTTFIIRLPKINKFDP